MSALARRVGAWAVVLAALVAVFLAWQNPHFLVDLSAYVATCF